MEDIKNYENKVFNLQEAIRQERLKEEDEIRARLLKAKRVRSVGAGANVFEGRLKRLKEAEWKKREAQSSSEESSDDGEFRKFKSFEDSSPEKGKKGTGPKAGGAKIGEKARKGAIVISSDEEGPDEVIDLSSSSDSEEQEKPENLVANKIFHLDSRMVEPKRLYL